MAGNYDGFYSGSANESAVDNFFFLLFLFPYLGDVDNGERQQDEHDYHAHRRCQTGLVILPEQAIDIDRQHQRGIDWAATRGDIDKVEVVEGDYSPG